MIEVVQLVSTIRRHLKAQGLTYRDVALALHLSEPSVKRLFGTRRFSVERLVGLSRLLGFTLAELVQESQATLPRLQALTDAQEKALVAEPKLLLTAVCLLNHWTQADIVSRYRMTEAECLKHMLALDRMDVIEVLPGNRVRLKVARDFDWRADGAIRRFFRSSAQPEFLDAAFEGATDTLSFVQGMLTEPAQAQIQAELQRLRTRFGALHDECASAPMAQRHGIGLLLAMREWEPGAFRELRRPQKRER